MNKFRFFFFLLLFCFSITLHTEELPDENENIPPLTLLFADKLTNRSVGFYSLIKTIGDARDSLNRKGVLSKVFPNQFVTSVVSLDIVHQLILLENSNTRDFIRGDFSALYNHIGKYGFDQLSSKVSPANALGLLQITEAGFDHMIGAYKGAKISGSFDVVVKNPTKAVEIAILFVDNALSVLTFEEKEKVFSDKGLFHDYIAAAYNGGGGYALKNLRNGGLFHGGRNKETRNYITNMRSPVAFFEDFRKN